MILTDDNLYGVEIRYAYHVKVGDLVGDLNVGWLGVVVGNIYEGLGGESVFADCMLLRTKYGPSCLGKVVHATISGLKVLERASPANSEIHTTVKRRSSR